MVGAPGTSGAPVVGDCTIILPIQGGLPINRILEIPYQMVLGLQVSQLLRIFKI